MTFLSATVVNSLYITPPQSLPTHLTGLKTPLTFTAHETEGANNCTGSMLVQAALRVPGRRKRVMHSLHDISVGPVALELMGSRNPGTTVYRCFGSIDFLPVLSQVHNHSNTRNQTVNTH